MVRQAHHLAMLIEHSTKSKTLQFQLMSLSALDHKQIERMFFLMSEHYDCVTRELFLNDLSNKQWIGLLKDNQSQIQGFTTFVINPKKCNAPSYNIVFSGDTIIARDYWGTSKLVRGTAYTFGQMLAMNPQKKLYWYLMSKGHRTYMYLPLFFHRFYPSYDPERHADLSDIADQCSKILYSDAWYAARGIVAFKGKHGQLKPELAQGAWQKKLHPHVQFFLEKNPGFDQGDELICITELHPNNALGIVREYMLQGMKEPLA